MSDPEKLYIARAESGAKNLFTDLIAWGKSGTAPDFREIVIEFEQLINRGAVSIGVRHQREDETFFGAFGELKDPTSGKTRLTIDINPQYIFYRLSELDPDSQQALKQVFTHVVASTLNRFEDLKESGADTLD